MFKMKVVAYDIDHNFGSKTKPDQAAAFKILDVSRYDKPPLSSFYSTAKAVPYDPQWIRATDYQQQRHFYFIARPKKGIEARLQHGRYKSKIRDLTDGKEDCSPTTKRRLATEWAAVPITNPRSLDFESVHAEGAQLRKAKESKEAPPVKAQAMNKVRSHPLHSSLILVVA